MSRYDNATPFVNDNERYREFFKERGVNFIRQLRTGVLSHPTRAQRAQLQKVNHVWKVGDRLYKIAAQYYGDPSLWWVIAWYNMKPTEAHFKTGDTLRIPLPLAKVMGILQRY